MRAPDNTVFKVRRRPRRRRALPPALFPIWPATPTLATPPPPQVTKGAPQVILRLAHNGDAIRARVAAAVQELADRGFRALGVAISYTGEVRRALRGGRRRSRALGERPTHVPSLPTCQNEPTQWEFQGVLSLFDPPRPDTKATIAAAIANG